MYICHTCVSKSCFESGLDHGETRTIRRARLHWSQPMRSVRTLLAERAPLELSRRIFRTLGVWTNRFCGRLLQPCELLVHFL